MVKAAELQIPEIATPAGQLFEKQRSFFETGITRPISFRKAQLAVLYQAIVRERLAIEGALMQDLRKPEFEAYGTEIGPVLKEITHAQKNLAVWMEPVPAGTPMLFFPSTSKIMYEPRGVSLLIAPWNYPFLLVMTALVNSVAAGNTVMLKLSEMSEATGQAIRTLIRSCFQEDYIGIIEESGPEMTDQLIAKHPINIIHFTGSTPVGKIIMAAASKQLTPVILELGGKSPAIVTADAPIKYAAKKILFSKLMNSGQTCVATDYILVHESKKQLLVAALIEEIEKMHQGNSETTLDYGRIVNRRNFDRLAATLSQGNLLYGGQINAEQLYIQPTLIEPAGMDTTLMKEEIFGPILPILSYNTPEEAVAIIQLNPNPLAMYIFCSKASSKKYFLEKVIAGGVCVNNAMIHLGNPMVPFGGVMGSGFGSYHGQHGFKAFSHAKPVVTSYPLFDVPLWYPPYKKWYIKVLQFFLR